MTIKDFCDNKAGIEVKTQFGTVECLGCTHNKEKTRYYDISIARRDNNGRLTSYGRISNDNLEKILAEAIAE